MAQHSIVDIIGIIHSTLVQNIVIPPIGGNGINNKIVTR